MPALNAFSAYGIELEYMIVDRDTLDVKPIADQLLADVPTPDPLISCSNELVNHVIEIKNPAPTDLCSLTAAFQAQIRALNASLAAHNACLLPGAMHPWMNPARDTQLWPTDDAGIYRTFDALFDCHRHPWANVQSMHINLPFADDAEFEKLHTAIRMLLPILPAIAASSPIAEGWFTRYLDYRMHVYSEQSPHQTQIAGDIIPDVIHTRAEYHDRILEPMYRDIASLDVERRLQFEWLNARGAIARFDRNAIEIRVMDVQECPVADIALAALVIDTVHALYHETFGDLQTQQALPTALLGDLLSRCSCDADEAEISSPDYLGAWGIQRPICRAKDIWAYIGEVLQRQKAGHFALWKNHLEVILTQGPLARRIIRVMDKSTDKLSLFQTYRMLAQQLEQGRIFTGFFPAFRDQEAREKAV